MERKTRVRKHKAGSKRKEERMREVCVLGGVVGGLVVGGSTRQAWEGSV